MSEPLPVQTETPKLAMLQDAFLVLRWLVPVVARLIAAVKDLDGGVP
jgi:hypothetical protein